MSSAASESFAERSLTPSLENYIKIINLEALTMLDMAKKDILPSVSAFTGKTCATIERKRAVSPDIKVDAELKLVTKLSDLLTEFSERIDALEEQGLIRRDGRSILVPDLKALEEAL